MSRGAGGMDVLVAEDDPVIRELLQDCFTDHGYRCGGARDGGEALRAFQAEHPPLVVTDVHMPVMNGLDLLKHIHGAEPEAAVLMLSGAGDVRTAVESLSHGAYDFLVKPVNVTELIVYSYPLSRAPAFCLECGNIVRLWPGSNRK